MGVSPCVFSPRALASICDIVVGVPGRADGLLQGQEAGEGKGDPGSRVRILLQGHRPHVLKAPIRFYKITTIAQ